MAKNRSLSKKTLRGDGQNVPGAYKLGQKPTPTESFSHPANNLDLDKYIKAVITGSNGDFADGTASDPSISFANDDDTGLYRIGNDNLGIALNGSKQVDISTSEFDIGSLDLQTQGDILDSNGNELLEFTQVASAVNHVGASNAATGNTPSVDAVGGDTNIDLDLTPKGTGDIRIASGDLLIQDGTAGDPSLAFDSEANTGIYLDSANDLGIAIGGSTTFNVSSSTVRLTNVDLDITNQDIITDITNGTKIGTSTSQKLGFFNATPVVQQSALTAADGSTVDATYGTEERDVIQNNVTRIGELETKLQALGLIA